MKSHATLCLTATLTFLALATVSSAGHVNPVDNLKVVDANGVFVGRVQEARDNVEHGSGSILGASHPGVFFEIDGVLVLLATAPNGFHGFNGLYYLDEVCGGGAYVSAAYESYRFFHRGAISTPGQTLYLPGTDTPIIRSFRSYRGRDGICNKYMNPQLWSALAVPAIDLLDEFALPLKLVPAEPCYVEPKPLAAPRSETSDDDLTGER